jgi:predicted lipid-binding transport protein (Tim44 family)
MRRLSRSIGVVASLLGLVLMLASPMLRAHHFTDFFREAQPASQVQRHIFLAQPQAGPAQQVTAHTRALLNTISAAVETAGLANRVKPLTGFELESRITVPRLLLRLKIKSSGNSEQDPLL